MTFPTNIPSPQTTPTTERAARLKGLLNAYAEAAAALDMFRQSLTPRDFPPEQPAQTNENES
jgi:hypothetical protein